MKKLRTEEEWNNLSMTDRAKYIKTGVESGLTDLESIKKAYNIYAEGGPMEESQQQDSSPEENTAEESTLPIKRSPILPTKRSPVLSKGKYDSYVPIKVEEDPSAYKERDRMISYYSRNIPYNEVNKAVEALQKEGATKAQIAGMLGNANAETHNLQGGKQTNGKAVGYYQLEGDHRAKYERFLRENNLPDNLASESIYAYRYMKEDTSKRTPYETQDSRYWRDKWSKQGVYQGITTKDALRKWNQNNPDSTSDAFLNLFEKAGFPRDQIRRDYSSQFYFDPNIKWEDYFPNIKAFGGGINKFAIGGPQKTELYAPPTYKAISPDEFLANIINPDFQHQSDRLNPVSIKTEEDIKQEVPEQPILRAQDKSEEALAAFHDKNPLAETAFGRWYNDVAAPVLYWTPGAGTGMMLADIKRDTENQDYLQAGLGLGLLGIPYGGNVGKAIKNTGKLIKKYTQPRLVPFAFEDSYKSKVLPNIKPSTRGGIKVVRERMESHNNRIKDYYRKLYREDFDSVVRDLENRYGNVDAYKNISPEYLYFSHINKLDPHSKETFNKFIERQSHFYRGVFDVPEKSVEEALTYALNNKSKGIDLTKGVKRGGDRWNTQGGLYSTESREVAERFAKDFKKEGQNGYVGLIRHNFDIDPNLSVEEGLRQYKRNFFYGDIIDGYNQSLGNYRGIISQYMDNAHELVWLTNQPKEKVGEIVNLTRYENQPLRTDRWTSPELKNNPETFMAFTAPFNFETLLNFSRMIGPRKDGEVVMKRIKKHNELLQKHNKRATGFGVDSDTLRDILNIKDFTKELNKKSVLTRWDKQGVAKIIKERLRINMNHLKDKKKIQRVLAELDKAELNAGIPDGFDGVTSYSKQYLKRLEKEVLHYYKVLNNLPVEFWKREYQLPESFIRKIKSKVKNYEELNNKYLEYLDECAELPYDEALQY